MISQERKELSVRFILGELKRAPGGYPYDITMPDEVRERDLLYRLAIEVLKAEPPPAYKPPRSGFGMSVVYFENQDTREMKTANELYPLVGDILWQLCLRGLLRPGTAIGQSRYGQSPVDGYALTLRGRAWTKACSENDVQELVASL